MPRTLRLLVATAALALGACSMADSQSIHPDQGVDHAAAVDAFLEKRNPVFKGT